MGKHKKPDKFEKKTFCIEPEIKSWLEKTYGRGCHAVVREVLMDRYIKEKARNVRSA